MLRFRESEITKSTPLNLGISISKKIKSTLFELTKLSANIGSLKVFNSFNDGVTSQYDFKTSTASGSSSTMIQDMIIE